MPKRTHHNQNSMNFVRCFRRKRAECACGCVEGGREEKRMGGGRVKVDLMDALKKLNNKFNIFNISVFGLSIKSKWDLKLQFT